MCLWINYMILQSFFGVLGVVADRLDVLLEILLAGNEPTSVMLKTLERVEYLVVHQSSGVEQNDLLDFPVDLLPNSAFWLVYPHFKSRALAGYPPCGPVIAAKGSVIVDTAHGLRELETGPPAAPDAIRPEQRFKVVAITAVLALVGPHAKAGVASSDPLSKALSLQDQKSTVPYQSLNLFSLLDLESCTENMNEVRFVDLDGVLGIVNPGPNHLFSASPRLMFTVNVPCG